MDSLYRWQQEALEAWIAAGRRGIVEAVTGSGKTRLGIAAIHQVAHLKKYAYTHPLVVVPTEVIMNQWFGWLRQSLPGIRVGRLSKDHRDDFSRCQVIVAIINSAVKKAPALFAHTRKNPLRYTTFLVADECHHYVDAPEFSKILRHPFTCTLGLSATLDPPIPHKIPGLGSIIYEYRFEHAGQDGIVPDFDLLNCSLHFSSAERDRYLEITEEIRKQTSHVLDLYRDELDRVPDHLLFRALRQILRKSGSAPDPIIERLFRLLFRRAAVTYTASRKLSLTASLITDLLRAKKKVLVFFERIQSIERVSDDVPRKAASSVQQAVRSHGSFCVQTYHSQLDDDQRRLILNDFRQPGPKALLSCRSLDEGFDLPEVDAAILAASTQSRRQRIQRIGRALRRGSGNKRPIVVTLYVRGSGDENVCRKDEEIFRGPATIHQCHDEEVIRAVRGLLG
ncbi:MAG: DEAD/DEAH box helicase family protein [bacterium]